MSNVETRASRGQFPSEGFGPRLRGMLKEHGPMLAAQAALLLLLWKRVGAGPALVVSFILGAALFGFWKELREPGAVRGYVANWKRALGATGLLVLGIIGIGVPLFAVAVITTPTAAQDWREALAEYGLTGGAMALRMVIVGALALAFIAGTHLICTRVGLKAVAVMKGGNR